ncbi:MAG: DUF4124 domain-containing protein [Methylococcales bacterium]
MRLQPQIAVLISGIVLLMAATPSMARAYRCTDSNGSISYSQSPCTGAQSSTELRGLKQTKRHNHDVCREARRFAIGIFAELRGGIEPSELIDEHGGINYINKSVLSVINYVSSLQFSQTLSAPKVGGLSYNKCRSGGFGEILADDFPKQEEPASQLQQAAPAGNYYPGQAPLTRSDSNPIALTDNSQQSTCESYQERIKAIDREMRRGHDSRSGENKRKQRREYQSYMRANCR